MDHVLHTGLELPLSIDEVFAFFADAGNLERITPPGLRFEFVTRLPVEMGLGTLLEYRLSLMGVPFGWLTRIAEWRPPHRFVDEQWRGPYARWVHTHTFHETGSGTLIEDEVRYRLPFSPLGDLAHPFVGRTLAQIFAYRQAAVRRELIGA
jgi:ligand-binding SRPBCC domain-containing protein